MYFFPMKMILFLFFAALFSVCVFLGVENSFADDKTQKKDLDRVTVVLNKAVTDAKSGQVEVRNDKDGNIGVSIGKKSFNDDQLIKNYHAILEVLEKEKTNNILKGELIKKAYLTSTMGVSYKIKLDKSI